MRLSQLSDSSRRLVDEMRKMRFGWIDNLPIKDGQPVFDGPDKVTLEIELGVVKKLPPYKDDFELKSNFVRMFEVLSKVRRGTVTKLRVQDGIPVHMRITEL